MTFSELVNNLEALPPAPEILPRLVRIMKDPDTDANDIVSLIQTDPSIVAGVLRVSNSGLYAPPSPVTDLGDAVTMLGIKEIYRIVNLVTSGKFLEGELTSMDIQKGGLWKHSLAVALFMEIIASDCTQYEGLPYTLGLLHDIGKLALHHRCGPSYVDVFRKVETERVALNIAEADTLGFDHAEAGAKMLENWGFPKEVYIPIRYQYDPSQAGAYRELAGALQVANWASSVIGCNDGRDSWALEMNPDVFQIEESKLESALLEGRLRLELAVKALEPGVN
jgi:putative nucleotidyltransferase with HDIG domain